MEKDQNLNTNNLSEKENSKPDKDSSTEKTHSINKKEQKQKDISPEEKISELEDKLTRTLAEMENQRRRFEKEKDEAFDYGGFVFARESLNLIDNLERAKESLKNDETLKDSEALKKTLNNLEIIPEPENPSAKINFFPSSSCMLSIILPITGTNFRLLPI